MITKSQTFCPAPWTSLNIDQTGRVMPCMHSSYELGNIKQKNIQEILIDRPIRELKLAMSRGEWHAACGWCKQLEETTGASGRTVRVLDSVAQTNIESDINWFGLEHIVINWSNLCNITCVYCNPDTSTAWQSVKRIPINHVKNEHPDLIALAREHSHSIKGVTLGGGEPLLQKNLDVFLACLDPLQVRVLVTTNLSVDLAKNVIYQHLKHYKSVQWMISFDNADKDRFEYVRKGASWDQFEQNIRVMKQDGQLVVAHPAYSIYNALDLTRYYDYCETQDLDLFWCELTHPFDLDVRRQSKHIRDLAIEEIDSVIDRWGTEKRAVKTLEGYRKQLMDNSYLINPDYQVDLHRFHEQSESILDQTKSFVSLWPELVSR